MTVGVEWRLTGAQDRAALKGINAADGKQAQSPDYRTCEDSSNAEDRAT